MNKQVEEIGPKHTAFMELLKVAVELSPDMNEKDLLICAAQFCGNLAAMQDSSIGAENVMATIVENIKLGNRTALLKIATLGATEQ